jgi:hypothetical protein
MRRKPIKCYISSAAFCGSETWTFRKVIKNTLKVLKRGAGEGWRSVGLIVRRVKKNYKQSKR